MSKTILKYPVDMNGIITEVHAEEGKYLTPIKVGFQSTDGGFVNEKLFIWAIEDEDGVGSNPMRVMIVGTGAEVPRKYQMYVYSDYHLDTAISEDGKFVFHFFNVG